MGLCHDELISRRTVSAGGDPQRRPTTSLTETRAGRVETSPLVTGQLQRRCQWHRYLVECVEEAALDGRQAPLVPGASSTA